MTRLPDGSAALAARPRPLDRALVFLRPGLPDSGARPATACPYRRRWSSSPTTARWSDGPILYGALPRRVVFLVKQEMFRASLGHAAAHDRSAARRRGEADRAALVTARPCCARGGVIGVFPEGTRGTGDVVDAAARRGMAGRAAGAVVLPVACRGTSGRRGYRAGPRSTCWSGSRCAFPQRDGPGCLARRPSSPAALADTGRRT